MPDAWPQHAAQNDVAAAVGLADKVLARRTSDLAFTDLQQWREWAVAAVEQRAREAAPRAITQPRLARPDGRTNPNPYVVI